MTAGPATPRFVVLGDAAVGQCTDDYCAVPSAASPVAVASPANDALSDNAASAASVIPPRNDDRQEQE